MISDFLKLLENFKAATENMSWKGSQPPEDWADIAADYENTKDQIIEFAKNMGNSFEEKHKTGTILIENSVEFKSGDMVDLGVQVASDGRVWICVNGVAFIRFKPTQEKQ